MTIDRNSLFYKLYKLSLPRIWLDIFLPLLIGAAAALNIYGSFNLFYFFMTALTSIIFVFAANSWIKYFIEESNLYQLVYYFHFKRDFKKEKNKLNKKTLLLVSILLTMSFFIITLFTIYINRYLFLIIVFTVFLFLIYLFLQLKMIDSFFDEFLIGLITGPLLISISFIIQSSKYNFSIILISLPISLLMINLRWVSQHKKEYSFSGFKILILFIYASFALIFSYFNSIIFLFLYTSIFFVIRKIYSISKLPNDLFFNNKTGIRVFSRKLYYYSSLLLSALLVIDHILET